MARQRVRRIRLDPKSEEGLEFLRILADDIDFLKGLNFSAPTRTEVRVASALLRRLMGDEMLAAGWHFCGFDSTPSILANDLTGMLSEVPYKYIQYAYAGGAPTSGAHHSGHVLMSIPAAEVQADREIAQRIAGLLKPMEKKSFSFGDFCASASVVSGGATVSRLAVVRYIANKLGGVHWDNDRGTWSDPIGSRHRLLDENHLLVGRLTAPQYEVASIAHAISTSPDIDSLLTRIRELAPDPVANDQVLRFREGRLGSYADMKFDAKTP